MRLELVFHAAQSDQDLAVEKEQSGERDDDGGKRPDPTDVNDDVLLAPPQFRRLDGKLGPQRAVVINPRSLKKNRDSSLREINYPKKNPCLFLMMGSSLYVCTIVERAFSVSVYIKHEMYV